MPTVATASFRRRPRTLDAAWLGLGVAILAASRPYEGLLLSLPAAVAFLFWARRATGVVATAGLIVAAAAAALTWYNWRVTGDPLKLPYEVNRETYVGGRYFPWDAARPQPVYRHAAMRDFYVAWQAGKAEAASTLPGFLANGAANLGVFWVFFLGPALTLPLVMLPRVLGDRRVRFMVIAGVVFAAGLALNLWFYPHYAAPATALIYALVLQSIRHLRVATGRRDSAMWALAIPVVCLAVAGVRLAAQPASRYLSTDHPATWFNTPPGNFERAAVLDRLNHLQGQHLVLVRYSPGHNWFEEWVYNRADIDGAKVIWARDMDEVRNRELLAYFAGRKAWLVEADLKPPALSPYPNRLP